MDKNHARSVVAMLSAMLSLYGCATASKDLTPTYVSPLQYQSYDCDQIAGYDALEQQATAGLVVSMALA